MNNSPVDRVLRGSIFALLIGAGAAHAQAPKETIRAEVGKPLQAAQELLKTQKPKEALVKVQEADAVPNKTPFENYLIERVRASAAAGAGDVPMAIKSLEAIIASGRATQAEMMPMMEALAGSYYRAKDFPKAIAWSSRYLKEGGTDPQIRLVLIHSYYQNNQFENAAQEALADVQAAEQAGKAPGEDRLQLLANSYLKQNDANRYAYALEKLVTYYPKKEYWADLIARTQRKSAFADRLAIDVQRLKLATGNMDGAEDYMELAQSALQAGFPAEAKKVLDKGYEAGVLGSGANADRHKRMRGLVEKQLADDRKSLAGSQMENAAEAQKDGGLALVNLGYAYVTGGQYDRGLALMERGMAKGVGKGVPNKKPQDSRLHLGIAYLMAGKKDKALETFKQIGGVHGAADMGRLWTIHARLL
jgi:hypothetical protein